MLQKCVLACAAVAGFAMALERPSSDVEATHRRRCCRYNYGCRHGGYGYTYQYGGYQNNCYQAAYANPCSNQAYGQTYQNQTYYRGDGTLQNQNGAAPAPVPAPDQGRTYDAQGRTYNQGAPAAPATPNAPPPPAPVQ